MPAPAPPSPLQQYLQSGYSASSGVDSALLNAGPGALPTNALSDQLTNLQLPADASLFSAQSTWDYAPLIAGPITASPGAIGAAPFSIFGLDPVSSGILILIGAYLLFANHRRQHR